MYTLRKASRVQDKFVSIWRLSDGSIKETPMTALEYSAISQKGSPINITGDIFAQWIASEQRWAFDTPSGLLEPGDVTAAWPGRYTFFAPEFLSFFRKKRISIPAFAFNGTIDNLSLKIASRIPGIDIKNSVLTIG